MSTANPPDTAAPIHWSKPYQETPAAAASAANHTARTKIARQ
jgi:hypothetical protein